MEKTTVFNASRERQKVEPILSKKPDCKRLLKTSVRFVRGVFVTILNRREQCHRLVQFINIFVL